MAAEGTTKITHTTFWLQLVYDIEALVGLSTVKIVKAERIQEKPQITDNLKS